MKRTVTAIFASTTLLLSGAAAAQSDMKGTPEFKDLDSDKDGIISVEEARQFPALANVFNSADADRNRQLSESEYREAVKLIKG